MHILIVGGGWSGLAAAVSLCEQGHQVTLLEAAGQLGGRARNVQWRNLTVDNGQHLMIGAYQQMLALLDRIGVNPDTVFFHQQPDLRMKDPRFPDLVLSSRGVGPRLINLAINLFQSGGWASVIAVARFQRIIRLPDNLTDETVAQLCHRTRQPERLIQQIWEPLCLAMLNTPIKQASAAVFATVLNQALFSNGMASELLIPRIPLGDILPVPAARFITAHGGSIHYQKRITKIHTEANRVSRIEDQTGQSFQADHVILALTPASLTKLLPAGIEQKTITENPICTLYLQYPAGTQPTASIMGFSGGVAQWLFDLNPRRSGLVAVVVSGPGPHLDWPRSRLMAIVCDELSAHLPNWPERPIDSLIIREKKATFACTPQTQQNRPSCQTPLDNLWLAGDIVQHPYPATLETAVDNGLYCVEQLSKTMIKS
ncbi:Phytoene desaturase, pro-zeta-carotene producing [Methylophaga frappieri]|uniref:Phytoene desaturase, pro-zeta-carotene producing n=1 Tax=Methylophaga frappieri (strain ATCC BAA-2434 / DSM 25690 / JAM7) TaxID=754477 RepID=I1YK59_METFJ|nr:hydroxysqualene dehydroxylase HpnE [Methylophaga frappieri]AFJ03302.1 Phytoene desaturase, pro-zeta-carotene producing [Methylophaga frappieri]